MGKWGEEGIKFKLGSCACVCVCAKIPANPANDAMENTRAGFSNFVPVPGGFALNACGAIAGQDACWRHRE